MGYKFNSPTYTGYTKIDSLVSSCVQTESAADPSTYADGVGICDAILWCVINDIDNGTSVQYGAAATILGFIPTILSMIGTSRDDHLKIHKRFPILAFLLSCCNPSTMIAGLVWRTGTPPEDVLLKNHVQLDAYRGGKYIAFVVHVAVAAAAGLVIWQALVLGMRGVVSFACPTWISPLIWVLVGCSLAH
ncbi:hypothetical protein B0H12DRAFT_280447 [Mycena haematopus]|nr:hypothetical protein B0H12DRAFT_280447 [Mycena haematopus]